MLVSTISESHDICTKPCSKTLKNKKAGIPSIIGETILSCGSPPDTITKIVFLVKYDRMKTPRKSHNYKTNVRSEILQMSRGHKILALHPCFFY